MINGKNITNFEERNINIEINGNLENLEVVSCNKITIHGSVGSIKSSSGDIECKDITGNLSTVSGYVKCRKVGGSISTMSGDIDVN